MQAHERSFQIEITVAALVVGAQVDIVETVVLVCHLHSENGRLQMVDMRIDGILVALHGIVSLNVHADVRVVDGSESLYDSVVVAFHLDGSSHLSEGLVG